LCIPVFGNMNRTNPIIREIGVHPMNILTNFAKKLLVISREPNVTMGQIVRDENYVLT